MKTNLWFAALSPFIGAVIAIATAAAMIRGSGITPGKRPGASIWDVC